jgi:hypothetical protein
MNSSARRNFLRTTKRALNASEFRHRLDEHNPREYLNLSCKRIQSLAGLPARRGRCCQRVLFLSHAERLSTLGVADA